MIDNSQVAIGLDRDLLTRLRPEAARRDISVPVLVRTILEVAVSDKLVTAILDEQR
jgi:hypothetical protein